MVSRTNWKQHIEAWQASGLSQAAYCRLHRLSAATFSAHVRTQKAALMPPLPAPAALVPVRVGLAASPVPPSSGSAAGSLVLRTASGHCLELPATAAPGWVAELLRCLG